MVNVEGADVGVGHQGVFGEDGWTDLVGPVHFVDGMGVGKYKQKLVIEIVGVDTKLPET